VSRRRAPVSYRVAQRQARTVERDLLKRVGKAIDGALARSVRDLSALLNRLPGSTPDARLAALQRSIDVLLQSRNRLIQQIERAAVAGRRTSFADVLAVWQDASKAAASSVGLPMASLGAVLNPRRCVAGRQSERRGPAEHGADDAGVLGARVMTADFENAWIAAKANTVLGAGRSRVLWDYVTRAVNATGDLAELGVWRGGSALLMARALPGRHLHVFDTFCGYPHNGRFGAGNPLRDTERLLSGAGVAFTAHVGEFPATAAGFNAPLAAAHIDCDLAAPAAAALVLFWSLLAPGGILVVDDYGQPEADCPGLRAAVDTWRAGIGPHGFEEIDGQAAVWRR